MKKWLLGLLFSCFIFLLVSCGKEEENVEFNIEDNIKIELEDYSASTSFKDYIQVLKNGEAVAFEQLKITPKNGVSLGDCDFIVSFELDGKEYQKEFTVNFVDEYSLVTVHQLKEKLSNRVLNGSSLKDQNISSLYNEYSIEGFYLDQEYREKYDVKKAITQNLTLFAKMNYQPEKVSYSSNPLQISNELNSYIDSLLDQTTDYIPAWNQEGFKGRWNYIDGVFLNSIVNLYYQTNNVKYKNFFINYINYYIDADGEFINLKNSNDTGFNSNELDSICESRILFDAYEMTKDSRYLKAIATTYAALTAMPTAAGSPNFWHKTSYQNQIWLDGMYMYVPFYARYAKENNLPLLFDKIKSQYEYIRNHMFDEEKKLYYHGNDTRRAIFWADDKTGNSKNFWLRSTGWFIVSLVDVLEYYPEGEAKEYLKLLLNEAVEGVMQYQDKESKMFYQLIDRGPMAYCVPQVYLTALKNNKYGSGDATVHNYLESSGSSMIAYTLMKAARLGYMDSKNEAAGQEIFEAVYGHSYKNGSLNDICITAGLGPDNNVYRDGSISYYLAEPVGSDDAKGVGPFIMAYLEYANQKKTL